MTDWSFRYRLALGEQMRINAQGTELLLTEPEVAQPVVLRAWPGGPIADTTQFVLRGWGYDSAEQALGQAQRWRSAVTVGFAAHGLGADFGQRTAPFYIHPDFMAAQATAENPVVKEDQHALIIFETDPPPRFLAFHVGGVTVGKNADRLRETVQLALRESDQLTERQHLAFGTYTSSFGQKPDARLVTLISAVELLIEPRDRGTPAQAVVDELVGVVKASSLDPSEKDSMCGALSWMRRESIGQAIRALAATVADRHYMGEPAQKFLARCYELRSQLVHGHALPNFDEVNHRGAQLERLVGDLIAVSIVHQTGIVPEATWVGAHPASHWDGNTNSVPLEGDAVVWPLSPADPAQPKQAPPGPPSND